MPNRTSKEQILAYIQRLRLVDDVFMNAFFPHNVESAQLMLRIIMDKPELIVQEVHTQKQLPNPGRRAATLDVFAIDEAGRRINIEVQLDPRHAGVQRARFYASLIDTRALHEGEDFEALPEVWVIFITEGDYLGGGQPLYHFVRREEKEGGRNLNDGSHIIYVGGANRAAGTALGDLMHDLFCRDPAQMRLAQLAQAVQRYKTSEEGIRKMSSVMEEFRAEVREEALTEGLREGLREAARRMLRIGGMTVEIVARITGLDEGEVQRLGAEAQGSPA